MTTTEIETDSLLEAMQEFVDVQVITELGPDDAPVTVLAVPKGRSLHSVKQFVDEYLPRPERIVGTARLTTLDSFVDHVNRHKDAGSAIFVDDGPRPSIQAVYDYHELKGKEAASKNARFKQHRAVYTFPLSHEWEAWVGKDSKPMDQGAFAQFLEDRISDVLSPAEAGDGVKEFANTLGVTLASSTKLMALSKGLAVNVDTKVAQKVNTSTGEGTLFFSEEHKDEAGQQLQVPGGFALALPLFRGGKGYQIPVRLRYRISGGKVLWTFALYNTDASLRHGVKEASLDVSSRTGLPIFYGTPEA